VLKDICIKDGVGSSALSACGGEEDILRKLGQSTCRFLEPTFMETLTNALTSETASCAFTEGGILAAMVRLPGDAPE